MKFNWRFLALISAVLLSTASATFAETYTVSKSLTGGALMARAKGWRMSVMGGNTPLQICSMSANWITVTYPFLPAPVVMYGGHTGTLVTTGSATQVTVQYEEPLGTFHYTGGATFTLLP